MPKDVPQDGYVLCDICNGVLYARDAPRHSTHTAADITAARKAKREQATTPADEAAEQRA